MNQNLSPLIELQKLDLRIMEITEQRRKIPERLHAVEAPLREARQSLQEMSAAIEASVKERRAHERDVEAQDAHTDKMRARLSELKTNKEYQAHLFELQMANKKKSEIEDKVLACMEKIEQLQQTAKEAQEKVRVAEQAFTKEKQVLDELDSRLSAELVELESQQRDRSSHVESGLLARYTKLKAARKDQPLAAIKGGMCVGCRLQIPPQLIAEVKRSQDLHTCPYCHRMLYWDGDVPIDQSAQNQAKPSDLEVGESV
ncbi:MAG TPA: C4-type zinc ribbon domain-containing protein [Nitrospira sp.]|nr:C4-type zinc ribbon domain-containing protein [Nitrospira sp.]